MSMPRGWFTYCCVTGALEARRVQLTSFTAQAERLEDYAGRYYSRELDTAYELRVEQGQLVAHNPRRPGIALRPYQQDTFASPEWFFGKLVFRRDGGGRVTGFVLSGAAAEGVSFVHDEA